MSPISCAVIDYGIGNVFSVLHALKNCGVDATLSSDPDVILAADRVILPGVGAFGRAADKLRELKLDDVIYEFVRLERPFLGICVGMQVLMDVGYEFGENAGLGLIPGSVGKINFPHPDGRPARVPLIGWYPLTPGHQTARSGSAILDRDITQDAYYFVHSYEALPKDPEMILAQVSHGTHQVVAAVRKDNVHGIQFHPELSSHMGLDLLKEFLSA